MPVDLIISPPASGKTQACIQRIRSLLLEHPFAPLRVVLPDRLQTAAFRRRMAQAGGAIGVQVGTFGDLYGEILEQAGRQIPVASPPMVHRLVQGAIDQVHTAGELQHFAGLREMPGFALALRDTFAVLQRGLVTPEAFIEQVAAGSLAQQELARLYRSYQRLLQSFHWVDAEGLSRLAVEALQSSPADKPLLALLVVDGFDAFNAAQRTALQRMAPRVDDLLITLPGVYPFSRAAHRRFHAAYQELASSLPLSVRSLERRSFLPAPLQRIEAGLFESGAGRSTPGEHLHLVEARSPAEEARQALRWLKGRVVRDGVPLHSCLVVTPDPAGYHPFLRQAAAEFGLPLRFTQGEALATAPAAAALLALLSLPALNYPRRLVLDALRSPYFNLSTCGLDGRRVEILDETSRYGLVIEGRLQWAEVFERLAQSTGAAEPVDEDSQPAPGVPHGEQAAALGAALERFFDRLAPPAAPRSLAEWIRWLEDLLDDWGYYQQGMGERDQVVFERLRETLRALVMGEAVTGVRALAYAEFAAELQGALEGAGYADQPPFGKPAALVAHIGQARGVRFQAVAVLGLSEGLFPEIERPDPFLDEALRQSLGLEPRLQREQPGLFYLALTRADRFLLLTRPYLAEDGERWEASPYWKEVVSLLPEQAVLTVRPDDPQALADAASPEEALFWAARRGGLPDTFGDLLPRWDFLGHAASLLQARLAARPQGPFEGQADALSAEVAARFGDGYTWSATRLETYGACPFQFYLSSALEVQARIQPEPGLDAARLGAILHRVLERAYTAAADPTDPQAVLAVLPGIARREFESAPLEQGFRPSPLWQAEQEQILSMLVENVRKLAEWDPGAGWQPLALEQPFGWNGVEPLVIEVDGQAVRLRGVVDRIDRDGGGRLRIIDYKTGGSHLAQQDLDRGRRLQLPLYALAAQQALGLGEVVEGLYWVLGHGGPGSLKLSSYGDGEDRGPLAAMDTAVSHVGRIVQGIRQADFAPLPPEDGCPGYCPARAWCWRFMPGWGA
jgi:ATP-dependent helicase/DNAse subunit B